MRAVIQRVNGAVVKVGEETVSQIGRGLCVLIGICRDDTEQDMNRIIKKILMMRLFTDTSGKHWNRSVIDLSLEVLCISQFTLCGKLTKNRPSYHLAMKPEEALPFFEKFLAEMKKQYRPDLVKAGRFGEHMDIQLENDGPVTIVLESKKEDQSIAS